MVDLESDCVALISTLASSSEDCSEIGQVVKDCNEYFSEFSSIIFQQIYRAVNVVAYKLANLGNFSFLDGFWLEEPPFIIEDVLDEDISQCT